MEVPMDCFSWLCHAVMLYALWITPGNVLQLILNEYQMILCRIKSRIRITTLKSSGSRWRGFAFTTVKFRTRQRPVKYRTLVASLRLTPRLGLNQVNVLPRLPARWQSASPDSPQCCATHPFVLHKKLAPLYTASVVVRRQKNMVMNRQGCTDEGHLQFTTNRNPNPETASVGSSGTEDPSLQLLSQSDSILTVDELLNVLCERNHVAYSRSRMRKECKVHFSRLGLLWNNERRSVCVSPSIHVRELIRSPCCMLLLVF
jgi:hypothetical protein